MYLTEEIFASRALFRTLRLDYKIQYRKLTNFAPAGMSFELIPVAHPTSDLERPAVFIRDTLSGSRQLVGNVPEGLQRKCNEFGFKTSKLEHIFLTGILDWKSVNGLPGLILTVSDQGLKKFGVYHSGNQILQYLISSWRFFVFRFGLQLDARDLDSPFESDKFIMKPVNIDSINPLNVVNKPSDISKLQIMVDQIFPTAVDTDFSAKVVTNVGLPKSVRNPKRSVSWIMMGNPIRGKFMVQQARELGCKVEHFRHLCNFEPVTLDDGTVINPEQVLEPTRCFQPILFVEIPSEDYLQGTFNHDWSSELKSLNSSSFGVVYHFIDDSINNPLNNPDYVKFIQSFGDKTLHFISHKQYVPNLINYETSYNTSLKWKTLLKSWFPLYRWNSEPKLQIPSCLKSTGRVFPMVSGQVVNLKAGEAVLFQKNTVNGTLKDSQYFENIYDKEITPIHLNQVASKDEFVHTAIDKQRDSLLHSPPRSGSSLNSQMETVVLGTGSALPSKFRNVLSNLVRVPYKGVYRCILLDAGENTLGTIKRLFSDEDVDQIFAELGMIYLSHLHADHHMGITSIIQEWIKRQKLHPTSNKHLYVVTPWQYEKFLMELDQVESISDPSLIRYLSCDQFNHCSNTMLPEFEQVPIEDMPANEILNVENHPREFVPRNATASELFEELHFLDFQTCYAYHCDYAYSCSITLALDDKSQFKVSYSGDTRPRYQFAKIGYKSDLLIHESTLEDDKFEDALAKKHSTTSEATQVAILMEARKVLLTHFSQRYRSFTNSEDVYKQLNDPKEQEAADVDIDDQIQPSTPLTSFLENRDLLKKENDDSISIEQKANIFKVPLNKSMKENAKTMQIVFAFDNMIIRYDDFALQREVIEREGSKLELLFKSEDKDEQEEGVPSPCKTNKKKNKKRRI
ncbi:hypothetical protein FOA43_002164 [Brettanomyces nanus]|uniref:ribonuclease Z n=1 Tax=Eeniella nana TaxID=13502 RepID=A0A875S1K6_EENNA|nr:uncharacterized protein FOA43_002164 [Brettanomyces nanus]QPG74828.1 hypothetical protein FOA43_002164 [Brettanomyces nanus]